MEGLAEWLLKLAESTAPWSHDSFVVSHIARLRRWASEVEAALSQQPQGYDGVTTHPELEHAPSPASDRESHLNLVWNTLMFFAHPSNYIVGERTGGILQGCPCDPPPSHEDMAEAAHGIPAKKEENGK